MKGRNFYLLSSLVCKTLLHPFVYLIPKATQEVGRASIDMPGNKMRLKPLPKTIYGKLSGRTEFRIQVIWLFQVIDLSAVPKQSFSKVFALFRWSVLEGIELFV